MYEDYAEAVWALFTRGSVGEVPVVVADAWTEEFTYSDRPLRSLAFDAARVSVSVVAGGLVLAVLAGLVVGFAWSRWPRWLVRTAARLATHLAAAALVFWVVLWSTYVAGFKLGWIPSGDYCDLVAHDGECGGLRDWAHHLVAPWIAVALALFAIYARVARVVAIRVRSERGRASATTR